MGFDVAGAAAGLNVVDAGFAGVVVAGLAGAAAGLNPVVAGLAATEVVCEVVAIFAGGFAVGAGEVVPFELEEKLCAEVVCEELENFSGDFSEDFCDVCVSGAACVFSACEVFDCRRSVNVATNFFKSLDCAAISLAALADSSEVAVFCCVTESI